VSPALHSPINEERRDIVSHGPRSTAVLGVTQTIERMPNMTNGRRAAAAATSLSLAFALGGCGGPETGADPGGRNGEVVEKRQSALTVNSWTYVGAFGAAYASASIPPLLSAPVTDVEDVQGIFRLGTVAGGVFQYNGAWSPISDSLAPTDNPPPNGSTGLSIGAQATHPTMSSVILVGTGAHATDGSVEIAGSGLWLSTSSGTTWAQKLTRSQTGPAISRISWSTKTPDTVLVATDNGIWRSTNRGASWSQPLVGGVVTDIARKSDDSVILAFVSQQNVFTSTNGGASWTINAQALPRGVASASLAVAGSTVYAAFASGSSPSLFKSTNSGSTFTPVTNPPTGGVGCSPNERLALAVNSNGLTVVTGCMNLARSADGGGTWTVVNDPSLNPGPFRIAKFISASTVVIGSDSGFHFSNDGGVTWFSNTNAIPGASLSDFDARIDNPNVFFCGTGNALDFGIGVFKNSDPFSNWIGTTTPAGTHSTNIASVAVDPAQGATNAWVVNASGGRVATADNGATWTLINGAGFPSTTGVQIHHDQVPSVFLYTQGAGATIRQSIDNGASWNVYPSPSMPALPGEVKSFAVGRWRSGTNSVIYANLNIAPTQLVVIDPAVSTTSWRDVTAQFPSSFQAKMAFAPSLVNTNVAFAFSGNRLWRTTSSGQAWAFMSATTPIPSTAVITNIIDNPLNPDMWLMSTTVGVFKTTDGGFNWRAWKNGLPAGVPSAVQIHGTVVTSPSSFQVVVGLSGRGIWQRDASGDDS
jgi:hypothetical protein